MIWIIGEYAERIDNADELLENFLDGFHDENTQVCYCFTNTDEEVDMLTLGLTICIGENLGISTSELVKCDNIFKVIR